MLQQLVNTEATFCKSEEDLAKRCSPKSLRQLAGDIVNLRDLHDCFQWSIEEVSNWIQEEVKLPQYKECFETNFINGRRLILLETDKLVKLGVRDFSHVKIIAAAIRKLYSIEKEKFNRSISLPIRYPTTLYLQYRVPTGPVDEATTPVEYFEQISILENHKAHHHRRNAKPDPDEFPITRFGLVKRKSVYTRVEFEKPPLRRPRKKFIHFLINKKYNKSA